MKKSEEASREIDAEQYILSINKQGRIKALEHDWQESLPLFEQAIAIARQVPAYYQLTESLIDLANSYLSLDQPERVFQYLQDAEEIATREHYPSLLGWIEKTRGEYYYKNYMTYNDSFSAFCAVLSPYGSLQYHRV